jgi:small subunit ribosomal protein S13
MRISGITIPERRIDMALTAVYGIGRSRARAILDEAKVDYDKLPKDLTDAEENTIRKIIETKYTIEGNLKRTVSGNIKRLKDIGSYRGMRHSRGLPTRGQRTKTNSRTLRGNVRKTMGSGRVVASKT